LSKSSTKSFPSVQAVVLVATAWSVVALLFFLLFSASTSDAGRPVWYTVATYVLENIAFLGAGWLCFRNWRSSQIVSGGLVWVSIGLGMFSYSLGNLLLAYWEIGLGNSPEVSPGDLFFILTYLFLGFGLFKAITSKQLNLAPVQWLIIAGMAGVGIVVATIFAPSAANAAVPPGMPPALIAQAAPVAKPASPSPTLQPFTAPAVAPIVPAASPAASSEASPEAAPEAAPEEPAKEVPAWAIALEKQLEPLADIVGWMYIIGDVILVVMATTLLLAFWGGRFSMSWRFIAAASISYYIADLWFNYATRYIEDYETGALPEVFWIFSGCLFAIGAALEYDLSTRRRSNRRRA
jgi:hypothetical protein